MFLDIKILQFSSQLCAPLKQNCRCAEDEVELDILVFKKKIKCLGILRL